MPQAVWKSKSWLGEKAKSFHAGSVVTQDNNGFQHWRKCVTCELKDHWWQMWQYWENDMAADRRYDKCNMWLCNMCDKGWQVWQKGMTGGLSWEIVSRWLTSVVPPPSAINACNLSFYPLWSFSSQPLNSQPPLYNIVLIQRWHFFVTKITVMTVFIRNEWQVNSLVGGWF